MSRYDKLFNEYVDELIDARKYVMIWWESLFENQIEISGDFDSAESIVRPRWPCGPASHPRIIAVYRKYYLQCEELNSAVISNWETDSDDRHDAVDSEDLWGKGDVDDDGDEEIIEPRIILIERLESVNEELGEFINALVFSPIGENEEGELA